MTKMHEHRLESNRACLKGIAQNLRALAHECEDVYERQNLISAAQHLDRGLEKIDELKCAAAR